MLDSIQLFFLASPIAGPKIEPSSFCKSWSFFGPFFSSSALPGTHNAYGFRGRTAVTGNSSSLVLPTGDSVAGDSGDIFLRTGTAAVTRGKLRYVDGSEGTSGDIIVSTDTSGRGQWEVNKGGYYFYSPTLDGSTQQLLLRQNWVAAGGGTADTTLKLPDTSGVPTGYTFKFVNKSATYQMIVQDFSGGAVITVPPNHISDIINNGGAWDAFKYALVP